MMTDKSIDIYGGGSNGWGSGYGMLLPLLYFAFLGRGVGFGAGAGSEAMSLDLKNSISAEGASTRTAVDTSADRIITNTNVTTASLAGSLASVANNQTAQAGANAANFQAAATDRCNQSSQIRQDINLSSAQLANGQKDLSAQIAACCCDIKTGILTQTNILQAGQKDILCAVEKTKEAVHCEAEKTRALVSAEGLATRNFVENANLQARNQALEDKIRALECSQSETKNIIAIGNEIDRRNIQRGLVNTATQA